MRTLALFLEVDLALAGEAAAAEAFGADRPPRSFLGEITVQNTLVMCTEASTTLPVRSSERVYARLMTSKSPVASTEESALR